MSYSLLKLLHEAGDIEDVLRGEELRRPRAKLRREHAAAHPLAVRAVIDRVGGPQQEGAHGLKTKGKESTRSAFETRLNATLKYFACDNVDTRPVLSSGGCC